MESPAVTRGQIPMWDMSFLVPVGFYPDLVEVEWGFYALSASKAIFRARTYNCNLFSLVMMIT